MKKKMDNLFCNNDVGYNSYHNMIYSADVIRHHGIQFSKKYDKLFLCL